MTIFGLVIEMPVFWLAAVVIFGIIEGLTMGLATIWFAAGAVAALVVSLLNGSIAVQVVVFFAVSILLIIFARKLFVKKLHTGTEKTNVDALIGKEAKVVSGIKPFESGIVRISGQEWTAVSADAEQAVSAGTLVEVVRIEGVKAVVRPLDK
ncbi:MAG: NfeD family protein [Emergencia sp.]|nr:NfeD family protein [Emergencia sp.]